MHLQLALSARREKHFQKALEWIWSSFAFSDFMVCATPSDQVTTICRTSRSGTYKRSKAHFLRRLPLRPLLRLFMHDCFVSLSCADCIVQKC